MEQKLEIKDLLPTTWFDKQGNSDVYVSVYYCLTNILSINNKPFISGEIFNTIYLIVETEINFQDAQTSFHGILNGEPQFRTNIETKKSELNTYLILFTKVVDELSAISELQTVRGLLSVSEGKNSNYWHVCDYQLHFPKGNSSTATPFIKLPDKHAAFKNSIIVDSLSEKISELEEETQNRLKLAFRWIDMAEHETQTIDEFLKRWFAIEVISMPDTTNIKPINQILVEVYNLSITEVQEFFKIGLVYKLRSNIVHNGLNIGIHSQLNDYLKAIFKDLLFHFCGNASEHFAKKVIEDPEYPIEQWMPKREWLK